jgi:hypothetical protein
VDDYFISQLVTTRYKVVLVNMFWYWLIGFGPLIGKCSSYVNSFGITIRSRLHLKDMVDSFDSFDENL